MSDNLKRYCAIHSALLQQYPSEPTGNLARHLKTLAALVCGIVGSKKTHLPAIASKAPDGNKRESRAKRFARFLQNKSVTPEAFFAPYAQALVQSLPPGPLVLVMDGSQVGRGCMALMVSVLYQQGDQNGTKLNGTKLNGTKLNGTKLNGTKLNGTKLKRALPLCWQVIRAPKGHFSQEAHRQLLAQAKTLVPAERPVIFLGDGEFDGCHLLADVAAAGWHFVCRTAKNVLWAEADWSDELFSLSQLMADGDLQPGDCIELTDLLFTAQGFGPVLVGAVWETGHAEPLLLVSNLDFFVDARFWYKKRFGIETFFSDQKSRGFYLCHSHLSQPHRLFRLLMATSLAYYWMVCLGAEVLRRGEQSLIHRAKRCDLSLFQLGLHWLEHCLNEGWPIPVRLQVQAGK